jgi:hypothetical protein
MTVNGETLQRLANKRLQSAKILIEAEDWVIAAYLMGHTLECALKAAVCKTLKLKTYPPITRKGEDSSFFKSHEFERLLIVSGLSDIFDPKGDVDAYQKWSHFTMEYAGDWISMRYNDQAHEKFTESKVKSLYNNLYENKDSILNVIARNERW